MPALQPSRPADLPERAFNTGTDRLAVPRGSKLEAEAPASARRTSAAERSLGQKEQLCGTAEFVKPIPLDYGWAGRIAAFSGRPGVCGGSRHVWQFTGTLRHRPAAGTPTREWFRQYEFHMMSAYFAAQRRSHAVGAREFLDRAGVTHVVLGEPERRLFPWLSGARLAAALDGRVAFEAGTGCAVIRLDQATSR